MEKTKKQIAEAGELLKTIDGETRKSVLHRIIIAQQGALEGLAAELAKKSAKK